MKTTVKFGTDGWRAKIAEGFTFENLASVVDAYAANIRKKIKAPRVAVGYDNRFMSEKYASFAAQRLAGYGFSVSLFDSAVPTPLVSWAVMEQKLDSGVVITSSHNPYTYNGFKIKNRYGAGATVDETHAVEVLLAAGAKPRAGRGGVKMINMDSRYIAAIKGLVDIPAIKRSGMKIVFDCMYGPGARFVRALFGGYGGLTVLHGERDPLFGGITPEPVRQNLLQLEQAVRREKAAIGCAIDGDCDRMAFVDDRGRYIPTHKALVFMMLHHLKNRRAGFRFVKTISGTSLLNRIARENGIKLLETPVGFKYIGDLIIQDKDTIGGEESGGIGFGYYLPERDGILSNLLLLEYLAKERKRPSQALAALDKKYGRYEYDRVDIKFDPAKRDAIVAKVRGLEKTGKVAGKPVIRTVALDGTKYMLSEREWILFRFSGTEPLLRIYSEGPSMEAVRKNLGFGLKLVGAKSKK